MGGERGHEGETKAETDGGIVGDFEHELPLCGLPFDDIAGLGKG
jgi:hypothetical protein